MVVEDRISNIIEREEQVLKELSNILLKEEMKDVLIQDNRRKLTETRRYNSNNCLWCDFWSR